MKYILQKKNALSTKCSRPESIVPALLLWNTLYARGHEVLVQDPKRLRFASLRMRDQWRLVSVFKELADLQTRHYQ